MKALSFGAVLWDIIDGEEFIGGAPFNLAAHLAQCDVETFLLTRIGQDRLGENALREIARFKVNPQWIQSDPHRPTGWAKVTMDSKGQPSYQFPDNPAHLFIESDASMMYSLPSENFDIFCFGTLEQKEEVARHTLKNLITTLNCRHIFYDINIRLDFYPQPILRKSLDQSTIVKLNLKELQMVTERLYGKALEERQFAEQLFGDHAVDVVCITKGSSGCSVHTRNQVANASAPQVKVADTIGSGDAFSAGFLYEYCRGASIEAAAQTANMLGAFVASCHGAVPPYHTEIQRQLSL